MRKKTTELNKPFSIKFIHALQRLNELQDFIPLTIKNQLPNKKKIHFLLNNQTMYGNMSSFLNIQNIVVTSTELQREQSHLQLRCGETLSQSRQHNKTLNQSSCLLLQSQSTTLLEPKSEMYISRQHCGLNLPEEEHVV